MSKDKNKKRPVFYSGTSLQERMQQFLEEGQRTGVFRPGSLICLPSPFRRSASSLSSISSGGEVDSAEEEEDEEDGDDDNSGGSIWVSHFLLFSNQVSALMERWRSYTLSYGDCVPIHPDLALSEIHWRFFANSIDQDDRCSPAIRGSSPMMLLEPPYISGNGYQMFFRVMVTPTTTSTPLVSGKQLAVVSAPGKEVGGEVEEGEEGGEPFEGWWIYSADDDPRVFLPVRW